MDIVYLIGTVGAVGDSADTPQFIVRYRQSDGSDRIEGFQSFEEASVRWEQINRLISSKRKTKN